MNETLRQELIAAVKERDADAVRSALARGAEPNTVYIGNTMLMNAARVGDRETMAALIAAGADVDAFVSALSALNVAVMAKQFDAADDLLAAGADINKQWNPGHSTTALHSAIVLDAEEGVLDRANYLLARGADTTIKAYVGIGQATTLGDALAQAQAQPQGGTLALMIERWRGQQPVAKSTATPPQIRNV